MPSLRHHLWNIQQYISQAMFDNYHVLERKISRKYAFFLNDSASSFIMMAENVF